MVNFYNDYVTCSKVANINDVAGDYYCHWCTSNRIKLVSNSVIFWSFQLYLTAPHAWDG